jgi:hypothetical protein
MRQRIQPVTFRLRQWGGQFLVSFNTAPGAAPQGALTDQEIELTDQEIELLDRLVPHLGSGKGQRRTLARCVQQLARPCGHLGRSRDPPPGIIVLWRGLSRLADIELGAEIARRPKCE